MNPACILLIDDDPAVQLNVGDHLSMEGCEVMSALSADGALSILRRKSPDLIILDIGMPGMSGLALLNKLSDPDGKALYPILIFTARSNMESFFSTMNVEGFLAKTSDPSRLTSEVKRILLKTQKTVLPKSSSASGKKISIVILADDPLLSKRRETAFMLAGYDAIVILDNHLLKETITTHTPAIIIIKAILRGTTGIALAASLADYPEAKGIPIILFDDSGVYKQGERFINVTRLLESSDNAALLLSVAELLPR